MRIFWMDTILEKGNLGMMAKPRGGDWLKDEILKLKNYNVDCVVSLLEKDEEFECAIESEKLLCEKHLIEFISFPIQDREIPVSKKQFRTLINQLHQMLQEGKNVVVHCRMGIGRTSLVCAGILLTNGIKKQEVFEILSQKRTLSVPDTQEQIDFIINL